MKAIRASIYAQNSLQFQIFDIPDEPRHDQIVVKTDRTVISAGTELSLFTGLEANTRVRGAWCEYPCVPGYCGVGRVTAVGPDVQNKRIGQRVYGSFVHATHQVMSESSDLLVAVPDALDSNFAAMGRMFAIAITALQKTHVGLCDVVVIIGLGQVGNMAGQFFAQAGAKVVGVDPVATRRALARECGFVQTLDPSGLSDLQIVEKLISLAGAKPRVVVEAVGSSGLAASGVNIVDYSGEVVLLGSPRAPHQTDVTPLFSAVHSYAITIVGAPAWGVPLLRRHTSGHSIESNTELIFRMLLDGSLKAAPLCSHILAPSKLGEAYCGLRDRKETYLGVVLDWENNPPPVVA